MSRAEIYLETSSDAFLCSRVADLEDIYIAIMVQMTKIPSAIKAWRNAATDVFNDSKLFSATPESGLRWRPIFKSLFDADKSAFTELLGWFL